VTPNASARRVLIADDHVPTRDDVRRVLAGDDRFEVCATAGDAPEAVHAAMREQPDVCLLDIRMPGSGLAAAWEIGARLPQTKIVILTVSDQDADLFAALRAGADGYLLKTMNMTRLPDALEGVCAGEAAMPRTLVARVLERYRGREPRWRRQVARMAPAQRLTSREWEVLELLARGQSTAEIAETLMLSTSAVRVHIAAIVRKLEVPNRVGAAALFRRYSDASAGAHAPPGR
jgi:DNA-binding NarL/FixJ family response regulator